MEIWTIRKRFEAFEWKFEPFERDLKHSNQNLNHLKVIRSIWMEIWTIRKGFVAFESKIWTIQKGFEAFESKFETFERESKHLNPNSNNSKEVRSIRIHIRNVRKWFEAFESISNNSNEIPFIWMQIRTIRNGFEGLGLGLGIGPWLGPCETTQRRPFLPKTT